MPKFSYFKIVGNLVFQDPVAKEQVREAGKNLFVDLDMSDVPYVDSVGIDIILKVARDMKERGGQLRISGVNDQAKEIMHLCGLRDLVDIVE